MSPKSWQATAEPPRGLRLLQSAFSRAHFQGQHSRCWTLCCAISQQRRAIRNMTMYCHLKYVAGLFDMLEENVTPHTGLQAAE